MDPRPPLAALSLVLVLAACEQKNEFVPPPPPEVTVAPPTQRDTTLYLEFTGNSAPFQRIELRARVRGFLQEIAFKPGQYVEEGQRLFVIDPKPFEAEVRKAEAELESARAQLGLSETNVEKLESVTSGAVSEIAKIEARAQRDVAKAQVEGAQARLAQARLDLSYTEIKAPARGRISQNYVDLGNLVGQNEATLLAEIVDDDKIYAWFNISEQDFLKARSHKQDRAVDLSEVPCFLARMTDDGFPFEGRLDYRDPRFDEETGTLRVRALFDNADHVLDAGLFVRLRIPFEELQDALFVPERALGSDQTGRFVLVVDAEGTVHKQGVKLGFREGDEVWVQEGLEPGAKVVVNGLQRARPGTKVQARPAGAAATKKS